MGDEDQTIYTFTGATSDYLIGFEERYPDARVVRLETNYRSTPEVLALANSVLAAGRSAPDERLARRRAAAAEAPGREQRLGTAARDRWICDRRGRAGRDHRRDPGARAGRDRSTARWRSWSERTRSCPRSRPRSGRPGSRSTSAASGSSPDRRSAARCAWPACSPASRATTPLVDPTRGGLRARARRPPRHRARRRGRGGTSRRGRHAPGARRGPGEGGAHGGCAGVPRRGGAADRRSRPAGPRPASSS